MNKLIRISCCARFGIFKMKCLGQVAMMAIKNTQLTKFLYSVILKPNMNKNMSWCPLMPVCDHDSCHWPVHISN